jgi:hypothetical protein
MSTDQIEPITPSQNSIADKKKNEANIDILLGLKHNNNMIMTETSWNLTLEPDLAIMYIEIQAKFTEAQKKIDKMLVAMLK